MDQLEAMKAFVRVVETGSFSAVAREMNTVQSTISKRIAALESKLGGNFLTRTSRKLTLTQVGTEFYERCILILKDMGEAENAVSSLTASPSGILKVSVPVVMGRRHIVPHLATFLKQNPSIKLDLWMNDRNVDLVGEGFDMAVRRGEITDSSLVARQLGDSPRVLLTTARYLDEHGMPGHPKDLRDHNCLMYTQLLSGNSWSFRKGGQDILVQVDGSFQCNNSESVMHMLFSDMGIAALPWRIAQPYIKDGTLQVILEDYKLATIPIYAIYPKQRHTPLKVRIFIKFLKNEFGRKIFLEGAPPAANVQI